jgi:cysteine desulfurase/selenocysteine lyase
VARFLNAKENEEIVFTRNTTEAINLVVYAYGEKFIREGDTLVCSEMEHHSNFVPWQILAQRKKARLVFIPILDDGTLDLDFLKTVEKPAFVAVAHVSNVLGTINPVREIVEWAHKKGAKVLLDGAQAAGHMAVDVRELDVDFYAISGHKMLAPTGIGALYGKRELLEAMDPYQTGGEMISEVDVSGSTWNEIPYKFEAGTPNFTASGGFRAAIEYLKHLGMDAVAEHDQEMIQYAMEKMRGIDGLTMYGPPADCRAGLVAFTMKNAHPHDVAAVLDRGGVCIRAGHHCAQPLHKRFGLVATARASFYIYNTTDEADQFIEGLKAVNKLFGR